MGPSFLDKLNELLPALIGPHGALVIAIVWILMLRSDRKALTVRNVELSKLLIESTERRFRELLLMEKVPLSMRNSDGSRPNGRA